MRPPAPEKAKAAPFPAKYKQDKNYYIYIYVIKISIKYFQEEMKNVLGKEKSTNNTTDLRGRGHRRSRKGRELTMRRIFIK